MKFISLDHHDDVGYQPFVVMATQSMEQYKLDQKLDLETNFLELFLVSSCQVVPICVKIGMAHSELFQKRTICALPLLPLPFLLPVTKQFIELSGLQLFL